MHTDGNPDRTGTPDGEAARGSGAGIEGTERPVIVGDPPLDEHGAGDLQDDLGRDPATDR